ncbi:MAG: 2TM domain-containing protein [Deltaproteobacteria bacterium]|jgi:hypothetical protein|nr:2TM domain-containing protein [Deltaproteobacteria bacterium]
MDGSQPSYTQDEVNEILKRALTQEANREHVLSHDELVEIAAEAGIERASLDRAMVELAREHTRAIARQDEAAEIAAERQVQLKRFGASVASHTVLNGFLYLVCTRFTGGTWFVWPLVGSGVLLALQLRHVIFPYDKVLRRRKRAERQRERERKRAERDAWKHRIFGRAQDTSEAVKRFETVVQAGVSALLTVAERKLAEHKAREDAARGRRRGS